jgi:hypothetical protein
LLLLTGGEGKELELVNQPGLGPRGLPSLLSADTPTGATGPDSQSLSYEARSPCWATASQL